MKWGMEVLSSYLSNATWLIDENRKTKWTQAENKMFENALAVYDKESPDRWQKVAAMIPGKTVGDVMKQYQELEDDVKSIEAGLVSIPEYNNNPSSFTLEWVSHNGYDDGGYNYTYGYGSGGGGKRGPGARNQDQERKKGVPWTEEEHKLFLMGLKKYGKGDWRNISRNFVVTRTPTQVASHAQKYFIRQLSGGKDKRRASIHDITTVNLENEAFSTENNKMSNSPDHSSTITVQNFHQLSSHLRRDQQDNNGGGPVIGFVESIEGDSLGFQVQGEFLDNYMESQGLGFHIQETQSYF